MSDMIGLFGLGIVGQQVVEDLGNSCKLQVKAFSRGNTRLRLSEAARSSLILCQSWREVFDSPNISIFVETIGGKDGIAWDICQAVLSSGRALVTANKAMLAFHLEEIEELLHLNPTSRLRFEAAVGGGTPLISTIYHYYVAKKEKVISFEGILNGSTNFLLTKLGAEDKSPEEIVEEMKTMGYLEADPRDDLEGHDAASKAIILARLLFGIRYARADVKVTPLLPALKDLSSHPGHVDGVPCIRYMVRCHPEEKCFTIKPEDVRGANEFSICRNNTNVLKIVSENTGTVCISGFGSGAKPTASAVISDIVALTQDRDALCGFPPVDAMKA